jgi:flagellar motility protein MotE (MotC chaperone)
VKEKAVYIVSFLLAFIIVTGLMIYLNSTCKNIFAFDFSPSGTMAAEIPNQTSSAPAEDQPRDTTSQYAAPPDTSRPVQDTTLMKSTSVTLADTNAVKKISKKITETVKPQAPKEESRQEIPAVAALNSKTATKRDSSYKAWVSTTVKLYESMETRKAAKIILGYSDNIARDILLKMKKKKAAEILAEFKPETATRIISVTQ